MTQSIYLGWSAPAYLAAAGVSLSCLLLACEENYYVTLAPDDPVPSEGNGEGGQGGEPPDPLLEGAPEADSDPGSHTVDTFGVTNSRYWFVVNEEQLELMNEAVGAGPGFPFFDLGDIYSPGGHQATYAEHLFVTAGGVTANYGKVGTRIIGQSTLRNWSPRSLPNIRVDTNEFEKNRLIGGEEHFRFNNGLVGSIFREHMTLQLYSRLGYPAPRSTYAWVGSNVWGPDVWVPYTLVEVYKKPLCERFKDTLGGGCRNMWEFFGDLGQGFLDSADSCQLAQCSDKRALQFENLVLETPPGEGFKAALEDFVNWESYHRFQCLSWILATGDDALHNQNNVLLLEQLDGRFAYLPYSVDISLGQEWYPEVPLTGHNTLSTGCQADPDCWNDTIASCEVAVEDFIRLNPPQLADEIYETLSAEGMLRDQDLNRFRTLRNWLEARVMNLPSELETYRELPTSCSEPFILCNDLCLLPEECVGQCEPLPQAERERAERQAEAAGLPTRIANDCIPLDSYAVE